MSERPPKIQKRVCEDRISSLSDDLLIQILLRVPTKDAVATTFLSNRWRYVWRKFPRLDYEDDYENRNWKVKSKSVWRFLDDSMRVHDAPLLESLCIYLGPQCPVDVDVAKWVAKAVDCCLRMLTFELRWDSEPVRMPNSLNTCKRLTHLILSDKILVDVPCCSVSLPSLTDLDLMDVVYEDEDSHVRLLSGCPVLKHLAVIRTSHVDDNVRKFRVNVPSLLRLMYVDTAFQSHGNTDRSLVVDTPALMDLEIDDGEGHSCSFEYMPHLVETDIGVHLYPDDKFLRSLSSIKYLDLSLKDITAPWCNIANYSQLIECKISSYNPGWCESLVGLLFNCPQLKVFMVYSICGIGNEEHAVLWNQLSSVPRCLSSHLEIFEWRGYAGGEDEKELIRYILQNSKCLKTAGIVPSSDVKEKQKLIEELESMPRASTSSQLLFSAGMSFRRSYDNDQ